MGETAFSLVLTGDLSPCGTCTSWPQTEEFSSRRWPSCGNTWLHALCSVYWKCTTLPAGKDNRHIRSAKAVVAPSWAINALNPHVSKRSYSIPIALCETQTWALPLAKIQAFSLATSCFKYHAYVSRLNISGFQSCLHTGIMQRASKTTNWEILI